MGRINLKAVRVRQTAQQLLETPRLRTRPAWYDVVGSVPPTQALVRPQPVQHHDWPRRIKTKKPSKMYRPQRIDYEEDRLRRVFFGDHPWELARPRVVLENDGKDGQRSNWSRMRQAEKSVDGESVVQRQLWLLNNVPEMTTAQAYDQARQEFYAVRHEEEVERRVAKEEAEATGAYWGKSYLEIGMQLEDRVYEEWKAWALKETAAIEQSRGAAYTGGEQDQSASTADEAEVGAVLGDNPDAPPGPVLSQA
ncbi:MAG: mitochondrial ribosomal small subunit component [Thelocarpon impressellum]|nr:MAG: mitochondrial ribosomal small subunit component [Thelocarpon impressellum]